MEGTWNSEIIKKISSKKSINYIDDKEYEYGNIYENKFRDIWENKQMIKPDLDKCRTICRIDNCNRYLHRLKNPDKHENFI